MVRAFNPLGSHHKLTLRLFRRLHQDVRGQARDWHGALGHLVAPDPAVGSRRDRLQETEVGEAEEDRVRAHAAVGLHNGALVGKEVRDPFTMSRDMADLEPHFSMGVLFGGVSDEDKDEETLDSTFYNELCVALPLLARTSLILSPTALATTSPAPVAGSLCP